MNAPLSPVFATDKSPPCDKIAVGHLTDPDGDVDVRFDEVDDMIGEHEPHGHVGIGAEKAVHDRRDMEFAEQDRRGHQEFAARSAIFAARRPFGVIEVVDQLARRRDERFASLGQDQLAARAHEQLGAEMGFEVADAAADGRQGCVQAARSR